MYNEIYHFVIDVLKDLTVEILTQIIKSHIDEMK